MYIIPRQHDEYKIFNANIIYIHNQKALNEESHKPNNNHINHKDVHDAKYVQQPHTISLENI